MSIKYLKMEMVNIFVFYKKDILFFACVILFFIFSVAGAFSSHLQNDDNVCVTTSNELIENSNNEVCIVIDAGHGDPDGGAVASDGTKESLINLQIAFKVQEMLEDEGINVVMTRSSELNIADSDKQNNIRSMKVSDINNRIKIANASGALALVSIHMNKFSDSSSRGWQTFYASRL